MALLFDLLKYAALATGLVFAAVVLAAVLVTVADLLASTRYASWRRKHPPPDHPFGSSPLEDEAQTEVIITLVHGTWAWNADWTHENSVLRATLSDRLPEHKISFHVIDWSGGNNLRARDEAARQLISDLHAMQAKHPKAVHFVVAHSHGGNVVMYSLRDDPAICKLLTGVVCVATPFLHGRIRDLSPFNKRIVRWVLATLFSVVFGAVPVFLPGMPFDNSYWPWLVVALAAITGAALGWWVALIGERYAKTYSRRLALPSASLPPLLIVRALADEASAALSMVLVGSLISSMLWGKIARIAVWVDEWAGEEGTWRQIFNKYVNRIAIGGLVWFLISAAILWLLNVKETSDYWGIPGIGAICVMLWVISSRFQTLLDILWRCLAWVLTAIVGILLVPFGLFVSLLAASISPGLMLAGIHLDVVADTLPVGFHRASLYEVKHGEALMHSRLYSDTGALTDVAAWIRARIEEVRGSGSPRGGSVT